MAEPTIDEMLEWLDFIKRWEGNPPAGSWLLTDASKRANESMGNAIRAILLHHKHNLVSVNQVIELEVVRAFVERVQLSELGWQEAMLTELAAMEKESNDGTND